MAPTNGWEQNTFGRVKDDDVLVSQHFFSLRLTHDDLLKVPNARVVGFRLDRRRPACGWEVFPQ